MKKLILLSLLFLIGCGSRNPILPIAPETPTASISKYEFTGYFSSGGTKTIDIPILKNSSSPVIKGFYSNCCNSVYLPLQAGVQEHIYWDLILGTVTFYEVPSAQCWKLEIQITN